MENRKTEWAVQTTGHIQTTILSNGMPARLTCKIAHFERLFVHIPAGVVQQVASRVGLQDFTSFTQEQIDRVREFLVGHPVRFRYYKETFTDGGHECYRFGGTVLEIL